MESISKSEFARRAGVAYESIRKAVRDGRLPTLPGGSLDWDAHGEEYRNVASRRKTINEAPSDALKFREMELEYNLSLIRVAAAFGDVNLYLRWLEAGSVSF